MAVSLHTPNGNIHTVPEIIISIIHVPTSNISLVLEIYTYLNTAEIEKYMHAPSGHINPVPINLTYLLSDNLNTCAINK